MVEQMNFGDIIQRHENFIGQLWNSLNDIIDRIEILEKQNE